MNNSVFGHFSRSVAKYWKQNLLTIPNRISFKYTYSYNGHSYLIDKIQKLTMHAIYKIISYSKI